MLSFSDLEQNVWVFYRKVIGEVVKTACFASIRLFLWIINFFWKKKFFFFLIKALERNLFGLLKKNYRWGCEKCILYSHSNNLMKIVFFTNFQFFKHFWSVTAEPLVFSKFSRRVGDHCSLTKNKLLLRNINFCRYRSLSGTSFEPCLNFFGDVVETASYVSIRLCWGQNLF